MCDVCCCSCSPCVWWLTQVDECKSDVTIGIVGKYTGLSDSYLSVTKVRGKKENREDEFWHVSIGHLPQQLNHAAGSEARCDGTRAVPQGGVAGVY